MTNYDLFPAESGPATSAADFGNQYTLGVEWQGTAGDPLWLVGYRMWRPADGGSPAVTGPITARTWLVAGETPLAGSDATFVLSGSGWQEALLGAPVPIALATRYRSGGHFPNGAYAFTNGYWSASGVTNGRLQAPSQAASTNGEQGSLTPGVTLAFPADGSPGAANYWITPILSDVDPSGEFFEGAASIPVSVAGVAAGAKGGLGSVSAGVSVTGALAGSKAAVGAIAPTISVSASVTGGDVGGAVVSDMLCSPWATPADVPDLIKAKLGISDAEWLGPLMRASELLFLMSGQRWTGGGCVETADLRSFPPRPGEGTWPYHKTWGECACWGVHPEWIDGKPYNVLHAQHGHIGQPFAVRLPRSPITGVVSVKIDGEVFTGWQWRPSGWLERVDGKPWPVCGGNAEVTYQFGQSPPASGRDAAVALGIEIAKDLFQVEGCESQLPTRTTSVTRQNVTIEMASSVEVLAEGGTGVYMVDVWLRAINPEQRQHRAAVWSPDLPKFQQRNP